MRRIAILFLSLFVFAGSKAQDHSSYNPLWYVDTLLAEYGVSAVEKLPPEALLTASFEYSRIDSVEKYKWIVDKLIHHADFDNMPDHDLLQLFLESSVLSMEKRCDESVKINERLKKEGKGGYYEGMGAWNNLYCKSVNTDSALMHQNLNIARRIFQKTNSNFEMAASYYQVGRLYTKIDSRIAISFFDSALMYCSKTDKTDPRIMGLLAAASTYKGVVHNGLGEVAEAFKLFTQGEKWSRTNQDLGAIAWASNSLGLYYSSLNIMDSSLHYFQKALLANKEREDPWWIAVNQMNYANALFLMDHSREAIPMLKSSINIMDSLYNGEYSASGKLTLIYVYLNIDSLEIAEKLIDSAIVYFEQPEKQSVSNKVHAYGLKALLCAKQGNSKEANAWAEKCLLTSKQHDNLRVRKNVYSVLAKVYETLGDYKKAYQYFKVFDAVQDSIKGSSLFLKLLTMEKQNAQQLLDLEKDKAALMNERKEKELQDERTRRYTLYAGLIALLMGGGFIYNRLRVSNKQKKVIQAQKTEVEYQKDLVDEKNREITSSIQYAQRLQQAILPPLGEVQKHLPGSFIWYQPKDIVAGDFYWMEVKGDEVYFAAADCTGHGVPGAMVSVVCSNALDRSVNEMNITDPAAILDYTRKLVIARFEKSEDEVKDGMDIALCILNKSTGELKFAGANNPLYHIKPLDEQVTDRDVQNEKFYVQEIKGDKQPIGKYMGNKPFRTHKVQVNKGDSIYIFTDGFADQFGGERGKKFKYKPFKKLLLNNFQLSPNEQKEIITSAFNEWRGSHEQIDDVLVFGLVV